MADKRGNWSKTDLKLIWKNYITTKISSTADYDLTQSAPCPECGIAMLKAQYQGYQRDKEYSWDVDHVDENSSNNDISNLQPIHPKCNKNKARKHGK